MAENKADNEVIDLEEIKKDELKEIAKEKGLTFAEKITKSELIELIKANDDEVVPKNFVPVQRTTKPKQARLNVHNGRVYKVLSNGRGMWADNGETFSLASLNNK